MARLAGRSARLAGLDAPRRGRNVRLAGPRRCALDSQCGSWDIHAVS
ncbi:hypothetical protein XHC_3230 [Xanthomonas hortorum pv. carotae str. M081]|nr:hypothetical protein XHC_3230 [Xanthomonas hortorum pv. carotae str. M081]